MTELTWRAEYKDGTVVEQYNAGRTPNEISSEALDRKQVKSFSLMMRSLDNHPLFTLHLEEGQRFIYRRRTAMKSDGTKEVCHLLGWQKTVNSENVQSIAYVFEDGRIELGGKFKEGHPWFYSPQFVKVETEDGWK